MAVGPKKKTPLPDQKDKKARNKASRKAPAIHQDEKFKSMALGLTPKQILEEGGQKERNGYTDVSGNHYDDQGFLDVSSTRQYEAIGKSRGMARPSEGMGGPPVTRIWFDKDGNKRVEDMDHPLAWVTAKATPRATKKRIAAAKGDRGLGFTPTTKATLKATPRATRKPAKGGEKVGKGDMVLNKPGGVYGLLSDTDSEIELLIVQASIK